MEECTVFFWSVECHRRRVLSCFCDDNNSGRNETKNLQWFLVVFQREYFARERGHQRKRYIGRVLVQLNKQTNGRQLLFHIKRLCQRRTILHSNLNFCFRIFNGRIRCLRQQLWYRPMWRLFFWFRRHMSQFPV